MRNVRSLLLVPVLISPVLCGPTTAPSESHESTRVISPDQHACTGGGGYPYRARSDYVLRELDLHEGDVVVDIGAGDGWWAERMAPVVGPKGIVYASEVEQKLVDRMEDKFGDLPQIRPYLCETDSTGLPENSCDLAFLSKTYHHLNQGGHVAYLRHLRKVVKPTGRICVIEKYGAIATEGKGHTYSLSLLIQQAEEAGWIPVRYELMTGTYHYIVFFVQKDLFTPETPQSKPSTTPNK